MCLLLCSCSPSCCCLPLSVRAVDTGGIANREDRVQTTQYMICRSQMQGHAKSFLCRSLRYATCLFPVPGSPFLFVSFPAPQWKKNTIVNSMVLYDCFSVYNVCGISYSLHAVDKSRTYGRSFAPSSLAAARCGSSMPLLPRSPLPLVCCGGCPFVSAQRDGAFQLHIRAARGGERRATAAARQKETEPQQTKGAASNDALPERVQQAYGQRNVETI